MDEENVIRAGTPEGRRIGKVLLDGREVKDVVACLPGANGWAEIMVLSDGKTVDRGDGNCLTAVVRGNVAAFDKDCQPQT